MSAFGTDDDHLDDNGYRIMPTLARLDERLIALGREVERNEQAGHRALEIASTEVSRRLELLNGEREHERTMLARSVSRELHDSCFAAVEKRLSAMEGRAWLIYVAAAAAVAALVAEAVRLTFHT